MDALRKQKYIDGVSIVQIEKATKNKEGITVNMRRVDRLNFDIDETVDSIRMSSGVGERNLMSPYEVGQEKDWLNTDDIKGQQNLSRNDGEQGSVSKEKLVEVYRYEGLAPRYFITGEKLTGEDKTEDEEMIPQRLVISGMNGKETRVHVVEKLENDRKTYIENWAEKIPGRWTGLAPAERVTMMQFYQNITINTRIIKNSVSSLGLFKIKKGSGITPQALGKLAGNGAIKVNQMDDIEQWQMNPAGADSYNDEEVATKWAQRDTNSFDSATGESGVKTTATEAAIDARASGSSFEQMGKEEASFWERVFNEQILPIWGKCIKKGDIIRLTLDGEELRQFDIELADMAAKQFIEDKGKEGLQYIDIAEVEAVKVKTLEDLAKGNSDRYENALEDINLSDYDVEVVVKAQRFDRNLTAKGLMGLAQLNPALIEQIIPELNDLWGVNLRIPITKPEEEQQAGKVPADVQQQLTSAITQQGQ
jgi:hypothetical protein